MSEEKRTESMKQRVVKVLENKEGFVKLEGIYEGVNAVTPTQKAAVRGILNRNCLEDNSVFERGENRTGYRLRLVKSEETVNVPDSQVETKAA